MERFKKGSLILLFFTCSVLSGQDRYMVFFTDKAGTSFSTEAPLDFLSQRSLDRRALHDVNVTEQDFPVNASYVAMLESNGADVWFTTRWMNGALVTMDAAKATEIEGLSFVESVEFVAEGNVLSDTQVPFEYADDYPSINQTHTSDVQNAMLAIDALHDKNAKGAGVLLAVFDGGFAGANQTAIFSHLHNTGKVKATLDFVRNSGNPFQYSTHGTNVLSCIAGQYGSSYTGTAPNVDLILAVTEEGPTEYRVEEYNWLFAAEYADSAGVDIINTSLGYSTFDGNPTDYPEMDYSYEDMDGQTTVITRAANMASDRGILVVTSMGNSGDTDISTCQGNGKWCYASAPADSPNVISVGATTADEDTRASFSSFGPTFDGRTKPNISARGSQTVVSGSSGILFENFGTSFSTPLIAGLAACIKQAYPELTNMEIKDLIENSGHLAGSPDNELGHGVPNAQTIITLEGNFVLQTIEKELGIEIYPNPFAESLTIENSSFHTVYYVIVDSFGKKVSEGTSDLGHVSVSIPGETGLYFIKLQTNDFSETIKLLKN